MTPVNNGAVFESFDNLIFLRLRFCLLEFFVDVKIVPQYDSVLNEAFAVVGNILLLLGGKHKLCIITKEYRFCKPIGSFYLIELFFNSLSEFNIINIGEQKICFDNFSKLFDGGVEFMVLGIGCKPL